MIRNLFWYKVKSDVCPDSSECSRGCSPSYPLLHLEQLQAHLDPNAVFGQILIFQEHKFKSLTFCLLFTNNSNFWPDAVGKQAYHCLPWLSVPVGLDAFQQHPQLSLEAFAGKQKAQHAWYPQWSWKPGEEVAAQGVCGRAVRWGWLGSCGLGGTGEPTSPIYTFALKQVS